MFLYEKSFQTLHLDKVHRILENSEVGYGITFDDTPNFSNAECIMVRLLMLYFHIITLVVRVGLFKNSLNYDEISNHIIDTIQMTL